MRNKRKEEKGGGVKKDGVNDQKEKKPNVKGAEIKEKNRLMNEETGKMEHRRMEDRRMKEASR